MTLTRLGSCHGPYSYHSGQVLHGGANHHHGGYEVLHGDTSGTFGEGVHPSVDGCFLLLSVGILVVVGNASCDSVLLHLHEEVFHLGAGKESVTVGISRCEGGSDLSHLSGLAFVSFPFGSLGGNLG